MTWQTVIPAGGKDEWTFDNFEAGPNRMLVDFVQSAAEGHRPGQVVYLWGDNGTGKTHLLHSCCVAAGTLSRPFRFLTGDLPVTDQGLDCMVGFREPGLLVCLDDLHPSAQGEVMEWKWLSLYETVRQFGGNLVVAASRPPKGLGLNMPDLISRLTAGNVFQLQPLDDVGKRQVLLKRARERGFDIPASVVEYILHHHARDTGSLFRLLDRIDGTSLSRQRRVTIPFLRELLADHVQPNRP